MFGIENYGLFLLSSFLLHITPGQDTMYILGRCLSQGRRAGVLSVLGIMTGVLVHTLLAALGLSVILATSAVAFSVVKYAGAAYLIWLGIGVLRNSGKVDAVLPDHDQEAMSWRLFHQGVLTNVLNPKVALFFLSFLPQFVNPQADPVFLPFLLLGLSLFVTGGVYCLFLVYASAWVAGKLSGVSSIGGIIKKLTGCLFIGLGLKLAFSKR